MFSDLLALLLNCDDDDDDDADADTAQKSYDNIPSYLQTIITAHLLSVGWEGVNEHPIASKSRLAIILQKNAGELASAISSLCIVQQRASFCPPECEV